MPATGTGEPKAVRDVIGDDWCSGKAGIGLVALALFPLGRLDGRREEAGEAFVLSRLPYRPSRLGDCAGVYWRWEEEAAAGDGVFKVGREDGWWGAGCSAAEDIFYATRVGQSY